jgi:hypothetical protein
MQELYIWFGGRFGVSQMGAEYRLRAALADFSLNIKVPENRKKGLYTSRPTCLPKNEEISVIFVSSGSEIETLIKNSK